MGSESITSLAVGFCVILLCSSTILLTNYVEREEFRGSVLRETEPLTEVNSTRWDCAVLCYFTDKCASFFYNEETNTCQLLDLVYPFKDPSPSPTDVRYYTPKCDSSPPPYQNVSHLTMDGSTGINKGCSTHSLPHQLTCASNSQFVTFYCKKPNSCADAKYCDSSATDGDYWLYPPALGGTQRVKVYCHNMANTPAEYISLPNPNSGDYPNLSRQPCSADIKHSTPNNRWGQTTYNKVNVDLQTMEVLKNDTLFASNTGTAHDYGVAEDCYTDHGSTNLCGPIGTFKIDTTGTGLIFDPTIKWEKSGWMPWATYSRSSNGRIVDLNCGGYCGGCFPDKPLKLQLYLADEPPTNSATEAGSCLYMVKERF